MTTRTRPVTLLGGPHHGDTVVIPAGLQAVVTTVPNEDTVVDLGPNSTAAQLATVTYTVHPRLPYATAPGVDLGEYVHLRAALAKLKGEQEANL